MTIFRRSISTNMAALRGVLFLLLALDAASSQACYAPRPGQLVSPDEQVRLAQDVAVGQVISATPVGEQEVEYRFLVLDQLAGPARKTFTIVGRAGEGYGKDSSFDAHTDLAFWVRGGGRVMNGADCAIHPRFVLGSSYLVFLDSPATWRSFEKIDMVNGTVNGQDKWLVYVKDQLGKRHGFDASPREDTMPEYERVGRFIYAFHRSVSRDDLDRKTLAGQGAPTELLLRAGKLADEFDCILKSMKSSASVPDAELDATLREAEAVGAALAAWRAK
jgi:hypothetical protein